MRCKTPKLESNHTTLSLLVTKKIELVLQYVLLYSYNVHEID